jgi:ferritin-like metal-binding protein YciE
MKPKINSTPDALAFLLQGLYYTETVLKETLPACMNAISSEKIRSEFNSYATSATNKLLKLERTFNYLMTEPVTRKNEPMHHLISEMSHILHVITLPHLRDMLSIGYLQNINTYKISCYRSAYLLAIELELDVVADLIAQNLDWELETSHHLSQLAIDEFARQQPTSKS